VKTIWVIAFLKLLLLVPCSAEMKTGGRAEAWFDTHGNPASGTIEGCPMTQQELEEWREWESEMGGIGIVINAVDEGVLVKEIMPNSPASAVDRKEGDIITEIDGHPTAGLPLTNVVRRLRGKAGTTIALTVKRRSAGLVQTLEVKRDKLRVPDGWKPKSVGLSPPKSLQDSPSDG
jgi:membrane-associated protease RseP (regulator of RpoE activity)